MVKQRPAAALAPLASIYRNLDDIVLASTPLRADADRDGLSRFGDDLWDMNPGVFQARAYCKMNMLDFSTIGCPVEQLTAKEYIFASLNVRAGGDMVGFARHLRETHCSNSSASWAMCGSDTAGSIRR
jgi:hypothetical protein